MRIPKKRLQARPDLEMGRGKKDEGEIKEAKKKSPHNEGFS